jgi:hypothetical protein
LKIEILSIIFFSRLEHLWSVTFATTDGEAAPDDQTYNQKSKAEFVDAKHPNVVSYRLATRILGMAMAQAWFFIADLSNM